MNHLLRLGAALGLLCATGCATMFAPGPDYVIVTSDPSGARVLLDGREVGRTPLTLALPRTCDGLVTFEMAGHRRKVVDRDKGINPVFLLNLPIYPIGMPVDLIFANQGKYASTPIHADLVRE